MKKCSKCHKFYDLACYSKNTSRCKSCDRAHQAAWRKANPKEYKARQKRWKKKHPENKEKWGKISLAKRYGLTWEEYSTLKDSQRGVCGCCGRQRETRLVLDHNHKTNENRGFICDSCNFVIGYIECHPVQVKKCYAYLKRHAQVIQQDTLWDIPAGQMHQ